MYRDKNWFLICVLSLMIIFIITGGVEQVLSQDRYPTRAIDIIIPFTPGGATDLVNRVIAANLNKKWGVPVNVINKPGGNTVPACLEVYRAASDGYTLLGDGTPSASMLGVIVKNLPFKVMDRTFVVMTAVVPHFLIVPSTSPIKSLSDLIVAVKKDPGSITWTSLGGAATIDFTIRQFFKAIDVDVSKTKPVMSTGGSQAVALTAGGHVIFGAGTTSGGMPAIQAGTVRPLAVTSRNRWPDVPDVPTTAELGYPMINVLQWHGLSGPPNLPTYVVDKWDKALQEMLKDAEVISKLKNIGAEPFYHNSREIREFVIKETDEVEKLWSMK